MGVMVLRVNESLASLRGMGVWLMHLRTGNRNPKAGARRPMPRKELAGWGVNPTLCPHV